MIQLNKRILSMDPFTPVKFDNGKMAYNGTVRSEEFGDVHEFWIKLSNRKKLYGSFKQIYDYSEYFCIYIHEFGFETEKLVGGTSSEHLVEFRAAEKENIENIIHNFFIRESKSKILYIFDTERSIFDGNIRFRNGWIRLV